MIPTTFYEFHNSIDVSTYRQFTCTCILRALMFDMHHSLRYVTLCCVFCSSFTHCNFKEFSCRFNGRSFELFLKRRKILELWKSVLFVSSRSEQVFLADVYIFMYFDTILIIRIICFIQSKKLLIR